MIITNLSKEYHNKYGSHKALDNINLSFLDIGLVIILGNSGCGKSTLLNIISGDIKDYKGTIYDVPAYSYLNQDINLFESMSVFDNLYAVCKDREQIDKYLSYYKLDSIKHKKIYQLSNGQKRRIQLLCTYLNEADMILLDEPDASLDIDNIELIMNMILDIAKEKLVIMVTHNLELSKKYADRIIEMENGKIVSDKVINHKEKFQLKHTINKKSFKDHLYFISHHLLSRPLYCITYLFIICVSILSIYFMFNVLVSSNNKLDYIDSFLKGDNIIVSYNSERISADSAEEHEEYDDISDIAGFNYEEFYINYDRIPYDRILDAVNNIAEIEAYQVMVDGLEYIRTNDDMYQYEYNDTIYRRIVTFDPDYSYPMYPRNKPFLLIEDFPTYKEVLENKLSLDETLNLDFLVSQYYDRHMINKGIDLFYLKKKNIPLSIGNYPSKPNDILIDQNTANMVKKYLEIKEDQDLIGKKISLGQYTLASDIIRLSDLSKDDYADLKKNDFLLEQHLIPSMDYYISGITQVSNKNMRMAFIDTDMLKDDMLANIVLDKSDLSFKYVSFIVDPNSDVEKAKEAIDETLGLANTQMAQKSKISYNNVYLNRNNEILIIYIGITVFVFMLIYVLMRWLDRKRIYKEDKLLHDYAYNNFLVTMLNKTVLFVVAYIISILFSNLFNQIFNHLLNNNLYSIVLENNLVIFTLSSLVVFLFDTLINFMIGRLK